MPASLGQSLARRTPFAVALLLAGCETARHTDPGSPITHLHVAPGHVVTATSQTLRFRATGVTSTGDSQDVAVSWSATGGIIDATGRYVMGATVGAFAVTATLAAPSLAATATVENRGSLSEVVAMPGATQLPPGGTMRVSAYGLVTDDSVTISPSYSATGGTIDANGLYTAGQAPGDYVVVVTATLDAGGATIADTSAITIATGAPVPVASVEVTPDSASVAIADTVRLTATPRDAAGNELSGRAITWSSDADTIATVDAGGLVSGVAAGSATVTATVEGHSDTAAITVMPPSPVPVASVEVTPNSASVAIADTVRLTATPRDAAGNELSGRAITWSSDADTIATVDAGGLVSGVAAGSATVTATVEGHSDTAAITVMPPSPVPVASVEVTPNSASVAIADTVRLTATPRDAAGNELSGRAITWSSDADTIATVDAGGLVSGVAAGSATVTATVEGHSDTAAITVMPPSPVPVASVEVTPNSASIAIADTVRLTATPRDAAGNEISGRAITWASDADTIATVDAGGLVSGVAAGSATVTATVEGHSDTAAITVMPPSPVPVTSVEVTPAAARIAIADTVRLTATPRDAAGNELSGRAITWTSDADTIAAVDAGGLVSGVAPGSATVTATVEGHSDTAAITVMAPPESSYVLVGAGDIADCGNDNDEATAQLLDGIPGTVFTTGDNAYSSGTPLQFQDCYDPTWGRHRERTRPSPGNHDYNTPGAAGYYAYFGELAGPAGLGYYSFDLGAWHIVSLNSEIDMDVGSPQELWLRDDLAASTKQCTLAYWHKPRFSSGTHHGNEDAAQPLWQALYDFGAELVLAGHEHNYERFAPQTPTGAADSLTGIRQFVVGTGGRGHYDGVAPLPTSEVFDATSFGVLKLTLGPGTYTWEFIPVAGASFTDSGSGTCH